MILKRLTVYNAGPFLGEWEVDFPLGVTAVLGEYEGAEDRSNRSGKSWLAVDAPRIALDGLFRGKRVEDIPHRLARGKEDAWVDLTVETSAGDERRVRRGRTAAGEPIRTLDGNDVSEADLRLAVEREIRGLTADEYASLNLFVQGEIHGFMNMTPADKRRLISPWFRTDRWVPRADLAAKRLGAAKRRLSQLRARVEALSGVQERRAALEDAARDAERGRRDAADREAGARAELARLSADAPDLGKARRDLEAARDQLALISTARETYLRKLAADLAAATRGSDALKADLDRAMRDGDRARELEARAGALAEVRAAVSAARDRLVTLAGDKSRAAATREDLKGKLAVIRESRTGTCPVLREPCDRVAPDPAAEQAIVTAGLVARRALDRAEEEAKAVAAQLADAEAKVAGMRGDERELAELKRRPAIAEVQAAATRAEASVRVLIEQQETARARPDPQTPRWEAEAERLRALLAAEDPAAVSAAREELRSAEQLLRRADDALVQARASVEVAAREAAEADALRAEEAGLSATVERLAWAAYAFGATGIPSREMENAFGVAEGEMNRVLEGLGAPTRVQFRPVRELKDWEPACLACGDAFEKGERTHLCAGCGAPRKRRRRDELNLDVLDGDKESAFELDSGGGKVLLSLGVRLGLASLPGQTRAVRVEHLIVDEPDGMLDGPNRRELHKLLRDRVRDFGIRQVILVTHADVRDEFSSQVLVHRWPGEDRSAAWNL